MIALRRALPFLALCLALFLVGCSLLPAPLNGGPITQPSPIGALPADLAAQREAWTASGIRDYTWAFQLGCECGISGQYTITVVNGQATEIEQPPRIEPGVALPVESVDDLYAKAAETLADGGQVHATWGAGGVPTTITFDPIPNAIDAELSVSVGSLTPTPAG